MVEYVPEPGESGPSIIEVYKATGLDLDKRLTERFNEDYSLLLALTESDRLEAGEGLVPISDPAATPARTVAQHKDPTNLPSASNSGNPKVLGIWETKEKLKESLQKAQKRILIESPWIKRATREYVPLFLKHLEAKKDLVILYGIEAKDEHDGPTLNQLKEMANEFPRHFLLIHLPTHLRRIGHRMVGSHRKLLIKDSEYFIMGSFNFLSMGQVRGQQVANEQSIVVMSGVEEMWGSIFREYGLPGL